MDRYEADTEVYDGARGRTRTEPVQVWMPDGSIRALSVYVGIDADADPALATLARAGTLHHIADGVDLAIPFVYHVPSERLMLLVVPEGLRHKALALRAEHLAQLAADAGHALPDYAREAELVIGHRGLLARLETRAPQASLQALTGDAQDVRALLARERDLMRRERLVRARERALRLAERERRVDLASLQRASMTGTVDDSELEEIEDLDTELAGAFEPALVESDMPPSGELELETLAEAEDEPVEAADLTEASYAVADDTPAGEDTGEAEPVDAVEEVEDIEPSEAVEEDIDELLLQASAAALQEESDAELWLTEQDARVLLFVRQRPNAREISDLDLLLQLDPDAEVPVALLTLVFEPDGTPEVRRGVVDPGDPAQVRALTQLAEHFEVQLVNLSGPLEFETWGRLSAPREANARAVLGRLTRKEQDPEAFRAARDELLRNPPPWREPSHPFQPRQRLQLAQTATEAAVQLDELAAWLRPARRERLRLLWSVPDERIDEHTAQGLGAALDWGLSLPEALAARAIELGLAHDRRGLLERRIQGLCRATRAPDAAGLEEAVLRAQWSEALEQAARLGVVLTSEAHELAQQHAGERAVVHAEALVDESSAALAPVRERALAGEIAALQELLAQGGYRDLVAGCRLLAQVPPEDAGRLFAQVARRHDPAAVDALLSLLGLEQPGRVRVGAALALAQRRALSAIEEVAANLGREDPPAWRLFALALARYGGGSFRAVTRALAAHKVDPSRSVLVLALLCCHGARAQVRARARAADAGEARLAEEALSMAAACKSDEQLLIALEEGAELTVFCRIFDRSSAAVPA